MPEIQVQIEVTDENPAMFHLEWLDSCSERVNFQGQATDELLAEVNKQIAYRVRGEFSNKHRQQAVFQLLGEDYASLHFPHHQYEPSLLRPPNIEQGKREELLGETRSLLDDLLQDTLQELGYPKDLSTYKGNEDLEAFLEEIRLIFRNGTNDQVQRRLAVEKRERANSVDDDVASVVSQAGENEGEEVFEKLEQLEFKKSDVIGEALCAIIGQDSPARQLLLGSFKDSLLMFPIPLRKVIWDSYISDIQTADSGKRKSKKRAARDFKAEVMKKMKGGTDRAVQSADYKEIFSAVIDTYHNNAVLRTFANDTHMLQTAHIINIVNIFDKEYSTAQIYWVLPYQVLYEQGEESKEDEEKHMIEVSSVLEKFSRHGPLSWTQVSEATDEVLKELRQGDHGDPDLLNHLTKVLDENIHASGLLFKVVPEVLLPKSSEKSKKQWLTLSKKKKSGWKPKDHELFGNLDIWLRKWISEAFVGILSGDSLLYVWDVIFMHNWTKDIFVRLCLAILGLLRPWLLASHSHQEAVAVLLEEPCKLYIQDIRKALQAGGELTTEQLSGMNSNCVIIQPEPEPEPEPVEPAEETTEAEGEGAEKEEGDDNIQEEEPVKEPAAVEAEEYAE